MIPGSHLSKVYRAGWGNLTDLYQLTMAYGYWQQKIHERKAVFHLFFRRHPFKGTFTVAAGLALVADYLKNLRFSVEEIQYLGSLKGADGKALFPETFLHYLQRLAFTGDIYAVPEGTVMYPNEPMIRVEAPLLQAQLIETALLTLVNFSSLIATKAARIRRVAGDDVIMEFGLRRAQGIDGGLTASRSAYLGGCDATSNVWAGQHLGIPVKGTHAHSWIMVMEDELAAFEAYAEVLPNNCIFLVDTYDTLEGVRNAVKVGDKLKERGHKLLGIRLDSGDLTALSKEARRILDEGGFPDAVIVASNDLDEQTITRIKQEGGKITTWGVGTRLATAFEQPALGGVYKLAAFENELGLLEPRIKLSEQEIKTSNPGRQQVRRFYQSDGAPIGDMIYALDAAPTDQQLIEPYHLAGRSDLSAADHYTDLLVPIFESGKLVYDFPTLKESRDYCGEQITQFERRPEKAYLYGLEPRLAELKSQLANKHQ
ncbi:MAG: nicotinate phosphoribosyltransferase [Bacteroidota bacterium]